MSSNIANPIGEKRSVPSNNKLTMKKWSIEAVAYDSMSPQEEGINIEYDEEDNTKEADLLKLSLQAYKGEITPKTMKLQGVL